MTSRVLRFQSPEELAEGAAQQLLARLVEVQHARGEAHLCLTGGRVANTIYGSFAAQVADSELDPEQLSLWWGDEHFVGLTDPDRNALQSLSILARTLHLSPSRTHPIPGRDGKADPDEAAFSYARDLGETVFDVCLLGMGEDGHVASLFPHHPSSESTTATVIGVTDAPKEPSERVTLTLNAINRSEAIWVLVTGEAKAESVARALAGDWDLPAARVKGSHETLWFLDAAAASLLPRFNCLL